MAGLIAWLGCLTAMTVGLWVMVARERRRPKREGTSGIAGIAHDLDRIYRPSIEHVVKAEEPEVRKAEDGDDNL